MSKTPAADKFAIKSRQASHPDTITSRNKTDLCKMPQYKGLTFHKSCTDAFHLLPTTFQVVVFTIWGTQLGQDASNCSPEAPPIVQPLCCCIHCALVTGHLHCSLLCRRIIARRCSPHCPMQVIALLLGDHMWHIDHQFLFTQQLCGTCRNGKAPLPSSNGFSLFSKQTMLCPFPSMQRNPNSNSWKTGTTEWRRHRQGETPKCSI